jgi:SAM-dependent methyltransferase
MIIDIPNPYKDLCCKICDEGTSILGVKDFNRNCEEEKGLQVFPLVGYPIYYHKCNNCEFIFTTDLDIWTVDDYAKHIYNEDYVKVDPEYMWKRPRDCVTWFLPKLRGNKSITVLDYGAGNNLFSKELQVHGYNAIGWDPMWKNKPELPKDTTFDIITAFEVLEHTPTPWETIKEMVSLVKPKVGKIVFSTVMNDIIGKTGSEHWYLSPRNGHVCMHSTKSLNFMFDKLNMKVQSFNRNQHMATWKEA